MEDEDGICKEFKLDGEETLRQLLPSLVLLYNQVDSAKFGVEGVYGFVDEGKKLQAHLEQAAKIGMQACSILESGEDAGTKVFALALWDLALEYMGDVVAGMDDLLGRAGELIL